MKPPDNPQFQTVLCAAILAGGRSSRMGQEKALLPRRGQPLIWNAVNVLRPIFPEIRVVTASSAVEAAAGVPAITDQFPDRGPLGGIHAALSYFQQPVFIVACDMPFLNAPLIENMASNFEADALVPEGRSGPEPLHAIYGESLAKLFETYLNGDAKIPSLRRLLELVATNVIPVQTVQIYDPTLRCFSNWNSPEDVQDENQLGAVIP